MHTQQTAVQPANCFHHAVALHVDQRREIPLMATHRTTAVTACAPKLCTATEAAVNSSACEHCICTVQSDHQLNHCHSCTLMKAQQKAIHRCAVLLCLCCAAVTFVPAFNSCRANGSMPSSTSAPALSTNSTALRCGCRLKRSRASSKLSTTYGAEGIAQMHNIAAGRKMRVEALQGCIPSAAVV